ncbi:MAG: SMI1/KNR4 family protein, partial [Actinomycetota bacterium]|nr:SMI1/KNR4 family protein [Actinomycetota bacterium]
TERAHVVTSLSDRLDELGVAPIGEQYLPLSPSELAELARRLGSSLPADYAHFASTYGRCRLEVTVRTVDGSGEFDLEEFFGGGQGHWHESVLGIQEEYADRFPEGAFPIAENLLGDLFLLWVSDPELPGSVWYASYYGLSWMDEKPTNADGTWRVPCFLVATTFTDLLTRAEIQEEL